MDEKTINSQYDLTEKQLLIFQNKFFARKKDVGIAYILMFFGFLGLHQFYLGKIKKGIIYPIISFLYIVLNFTRVGTFILLLFNVDIYQFPLWIFNMTIFILAGLYIYDIFTLSTQVKKTNNEIEDDILDFFVKL